MTNSPKYPRPKKPPTTVHRSMRIPTKLWEQTQARAHENGETVTEVLVRALVEYVAEGKDRAA